MFDVIEITKSLMMGVPGYIPELAQPSIKLATVAQALELTAAEDCEAFVVANMADLHSSTLTLTNYSQCSMDACADEDGRWQAAGNSPVAVLGALKVSIDALNKGLTEAAIADDALTLTNFATQATAFSPLPGVTISTSVEDAFDNPALLVGFPWTLNDGSDADIHQHLTRFNPMPAIVGNPEEVAVQITLPNSNSPFTIPAGGWPVVIVMHGLGQGKEATLATAGAYAAVGIATIAIDMPLHGEHSNDLNTDGEYIVTASSDIFGEAIGRDDVFNNGDITKFINVSSPLTVRDNFLQAIVDHLALRLALNSMPDISGILDTFNTSEISIQGLSLGGIVGTSVATYANSNPTLPYAIINATLVVPTGGLAGSFTGSADFFFCLI